MNCKVCEYPLEDNPPSGVCSEVCLRIGQGFPVPGVPGEMQDAVKFFYLNAGFSWSPGKEEPWEGRLRCAAELAKAERDAKEEGVDFWWEDDEVPWDGDCDPPEEVLTCIAFKFTHKNVLASLCGIGDPSPAYRRVVEAELAMEALEGLAAEEADKIPQL